jgi:hypothetical protein
MSSNEIKNVLEDLCATIFEGGRVVVTGANKIMLYDVPCWPGTRTDALRQRFLHCNVDIYQAQNSSASGFVVVVTTSDPVSYFGVCCTVTVSIVAAVLTAAAAMSVFVAHHSDWTDMNFYSVHAYNQTEF